jgi:hypothetical protein
MPNAALAALVVFGVSCSTPGSSPDSESLVEPTEYYSPYLQSGVLADWADTAVKRGVGIQVHPGVAAYPDGRVIDPNRKYTREQYEEDIRVANRAANLVGGWDHIRETSDQTFASLEDLSLSLFVNNSESVQYAQALAATMMIYPELRAVYWQTVSGGSTSGTSQKSS